MWVPPTGNRWLGDEDAIKICRKQKWCTELDDRCKFAGVQVKQCVCMCVCVI